MCVSNSLKKYDGCMEKHKKYWIHKKYHHMYKLPDHHKYNMHISTLLYNVLKSIINYC